MKTLLLLNLLLIFSLTARAEACNADIAPPNALAQISATGRQLQSNPILTNIIYYIPYSHTLTLEVNTNYGYKEDPRMEEARESCEDLYQKATKNMPGGSFSPSACKLRKYEVQFPEGPRMYSGASVDIVVTDEKLAKALGKKYQGTCETFYAYYLLEQFRTPFCERGESAVEDDLP